MARLTRAQRLAQANPRRSQIIPIPPAIMGWNTRDALDAMDPTDAILLDNWYPDAGGLTVRNGSASFATGMGSGSVETLGEYYAAGTRKFLAAANNAIYDISGGGAVGAALASGFTSNRWQTCNFNAWMFWANGSDVVQSFDGTTFGAAGFTGPGTNPIGVLPFHNRLYLWESNSQGFWYGGLNSITGALTFFPLNTVTQFGGNVMFCTTFSHDGGEGVTDFFAVVMTTGEVIIYQGTDPSLAGVWALVGRYRISPPVNIRAVCRYGAESYITTYDDHVPLNTELVALQSGVPPPRSKISGAVQAAMAANPSGFGWEAIFYPKGRRLMFNVPNVDGTFSQHVFNTSQNAWCRFAGMASSTWGLYKDNLYFGTSNGAVFRADFGSLDGSQAVAADGQQAWNPLNSPQRKRIAAARPVVQGSGNPNYAFAVGFDYGDTDAPVVSASPPGGSQWDVSIWDVALWSPEATVDSRWHAVGGSGSVVSFRLRAAAASPVAWLKTDILCEVGDAL